MKATIVKMLGLVVLTFFTGHAQAEDPLKMESYPVELRVGEVFQVCKSGKVICPVKATVCDDSTIVELVDTPDGLGIRGTSPGGTLCSTGSNITNHRPLFRITVR